MAKEQDEVKLEELLKCAQGYVMTAEEKEAQRQSWARGELALSAHEAQTTRLRIAPSVRDARIPNVDTLADFIDRLIVEVNKLSWFENRKREVQGWDFPDPTLVADLDDKSRDCCELRSMLKNRINKLFEEILASKEYRVLREVRTFRAPARSLAEVMADRCHDIGNIFLRGEMAEALEKELVGE